MVNCLLSEYYSARMALHYTTDDSIDNANDFVRFFLEHPWLNSAHKYDALSVGTSGMIFRGQSNSEWPLIPSAFRPNAFDRFTPQPPWTGSNENLRLIEIGTLLYAEARAVFVFLETADALGLETPLDFAEAKRGIDVIQAAYRNDSSYDYSEPFPTPSFEHATALAQHHGVPTRLLDWSESPLIACYFAAYGASSFATEPPKANQMIAVVYVQSRPLRDEKYPIELVRVPRTGQNMRAQRGVFTSITHANLYYKEHGSLPSMNQALWDCQLQGKPQLHRVTLPATKADDLLRKLYDLNITRHTMMPSLDNAALAADYTLTLFP